MENRHWRKMPVTFTDLRNLFRMYRMCLQVFVNHTEESKFLCPCTEKGNWKLSNDTKLIEIELLLLKI